jgi:hypothetical protein
MVLLKHTLPYGGDLLLFSPSSIFTIKGGDVFSNATVTLDLTMEYPCSSLCKPIVAGSTGVFVFENGDYSGVYEIYTDSSYVTAARNITEQVPCYLPAKIFKMAGTTVNNMICLLSLNEPNTVYVYNYYYSSETKAQSSWHKWSFDNAQRVLNVDFIDNWLYLTIQYEDGIYLERMNCTQKQVDVELGFLTHLDRKFRPTTTYDKETNKTTFTLPYATTAEVLNVISLENGFNLAFTKEGDVVSLEGEFPKLIVGTPYKSYWELGTIYKRQSTDSGMQSVEGILMLKDIELSYIDSGGFEVHANHLYLDQNASVYTCDCTCTTLGTNSAVIGETSIESGVFIIPVMAKNDEVKITVENNSYLPSTFHSLTWLGDLYIRGGK